MSKKMKVGKFLGQLVVVSLLSAVILSFVSWLVNLITPFAGVFGNLLIAVISVMFFVWAMKINPGKEEFLTTLPIIILSIAIVELLKTFVTVIPALAIPFTFTGLAFGLGSVFLATMITKKYIIK